LLHYVQVSVSCHTTKLCPVPLKMKPLTYFVNLLYILSSSPQV
jgi:hypothetical protein